MNASERHQTKLRGVYRLLVNAIGEVMSQVFSATFVIYPFIREDGERDSWRVKSRIPLFPDFVNNSLEEEMEDALSVPWENVRE